ncbi:MAG: metal-dependent transcriptional regulator [Candidatus Omnitrophota bacterium]|jgi:DtxR family Mn-dependent transcriptional regulator|nr:metal-dependent transcriptional regulator [Candidatus Omnitrophota bacterium]
MKTTAKKITPSMEDYLEAVHFLEQKHGFARVSDIASKAGVKKSSVNTALKNLSVKGLLEHKRYGSACLTKSGRKLAVKLQSKEDILFRFLTQYLFIDSDIAREEACKLEHSVSQLTLSRMTDFFSFIEGVFSGKGCDDGAGSLERHMNKIHKKGKKG